MIKLILIVTVLFSTSLFAGFTKGNGGNILFCKDAKNIVLDFYELGEQHQFTFSTQLDNDAEFSKIIISRLGLINPQIAKEYKEIQADLENRVHFVESELGTVNDVFVVVIPKNCEVKQTAIQINNRIILSHPLFETLSLIQKNILLLHEVIYSIVLSKISLDDSRPVRALVALLLSDEFNSMNKAELTNFLRKNNLPF